MSSLTILKPGLFTTLQDQGRYGYRKYGIPISGAMDKYASGLANALLNKPENAPIIEIILQGPQIRFDEDTYIAITGADLCPNIDGKEIKMNAVILVKKDQIISFGKINYGAIAYIATSHELISDQVLGSLSYYKGITSVHRFYSGQTIYLKKLESNFSIPSSYTKPQKDHFFMKDLKFIKGPEYELLNAQNQELLGQNPFKISREFSRMGYKLEGPPLLLKEASSMISSAVMPGTVQLTPAGQLIILMNDCQTTGGYPRVLQLPQNCINQLAQKKAGDSFKFSDQ